MKINEKNMQLYAITDQSWLGERTLESVVEEALEGGVTCLQLREKELDEDSFLKEAQVIKRLCKKYQVPFIINDSIEIAVACDADGVHVGQSDLEAGNARELLGEDKIIGVSAKTVEAALRAQERGADYLGVGAVFGTTTKKDATGVSFETLKAICEAVTIPVVAIGGITKENLLELKGCEANGVAVISAIFAQTDIRQAVIHLKKLSEEMTGPQ